MHLISISAARVMRAACLLIVCALPACSPACFVKPDIAYEESKEPEAPDYRNPEHWAALPSKEDNADLTPPTAEDAQATARADVFFIHPTTWFGREQWNTAVDEPAPREFVDELVMSTQASAFNGCCRVYAPRYRQAAIGAYFAPLEQAEQAFGVAYSDIERAFEVFLDEHNKGRPFILAAHSQGSQHAMRLLTHIDADPALRERMIAAYIPGFALPMTRYEISYAHLRPCALPTDTSCINTWDTYEREAEPDYAPLKYWIQGKLTKVPLDTPRQCTNPVSWRTDEEPTEQDAHIGAIEEKNEGKALNILRAARTGKPAGVHVTGLTRPLPDLVTTRCENGVLRVPNLDNIEAFEAVEMSPGNYHLHDYGLFYMDIRANAIDRTEAWLHAHTTPTATR